MRSLSIITAASILMFASCIKKNSGPTYMNNATIIGPDVAVPPCGPGYWIQIYKGADTIFSGFDTLPSGSGINLSTATFPLNVKINWHEISGGCDSIISIDAIARD